MSKKSKKQGKADPTSGQAKRTPAPELVSKDSKPKPIVVLGEPPKRKWLLVLSAVCFVGWMGFLIYVAINVVFA